MERFDLAISGQLLGDGSRPGRYVTVWQDECEAYQERSGWYGSGNADIYGRLASPEGTLDGSGYAIASESQEETLPRLSADGGWSLVVWQRANTGGTGDDLYGRRLWGDGRPSDDDPTFQLMEAAGDQESPAVAGDGTGGWLVAWQDDRNGDWDIYGTTLQDERRVIAYEYDGLYRLTEASYSTGEKFAYDYDAVGNREAMTVTAPLGGTEVTTYTYDAANRLTYVGGVALTWDNNGNLVEDHEGTEYAYDTANRLIRVVQDGMTYTFSYNGTGDRLSQSVGGAVTTYTLDLYGGLTQVLGDGASVYLYGLGRVGRRGRPGGCTTWAMRWARCGSWRMGMGRWCWIGATGRMAGCWRVAGAGGAPTALRASGPTGQGWCSCGQGIWIRGSADS